MLNMLLFIPSGGEILLIFLVVLILFGADKIPDLARMFGKGLREFRRATDDIKREFEHTTNDISSEFDTEKKNIQGDIKEIKSSIDTKLSNEDPYSENSDETQKPSRTFIDEDNSIDTSSNDIESTETTDEKNT